MTNLLTKFLILGIIIFNSIFALNANEKDFFYDSLTLSQNNETIIKYSDGNTNYTKKSKNMVVLGALGIPTLLIGLGLEGAGAFLFVFSILNESIWSSSSSSYGASIPASWYYMKWIGLGLIAGGSVLTIGGLAMIIVGFVLAGYYKKKSKNISLLIDYDNNCNNFKYGIVIKF